MIWRIVLAMTYVEVAVVKQHTGRSIFSYETDHTLAVGTLVRVPYGRMQALGIVVGIVKKPTFKTKAVADILPVSLPDSALYLLKWMFDFYPDDWGTIAQLFVPPNFVTKPQKQTVRLVQGEAEPLPPANPEQASALKILRRPATKRALLHGDTGTGKTRVFTDIINQVIDSGKSVLILTPEIGLTPQLIQQIARHVAAPVAVTHSALTPAERRRVWEYAIGGQQPSVFVGPRSALFLPINNLGLIVIDEAHDASYKQGQSPRYQTLHVAAQLALLHDARLIQSTATPNIDDYEFARLHGYAIIRMTTPAAGKHESVGELIDMTDRDNFNQNPYLSDALIEAINKALASGQQSMLFLNRRGSARLVQCANCGWQALCPRCGIPLTYHHDQYVVRCHTCAYKKTAPSSCPECGSADILFKSIGTKSLAQITAKLFPKARIMRFDADSTASEQLHRHIDTLKTGQVDIVIGTQLISKGIDLPNLTVVGVVNADTGMNLPDFKAEETTFQQLYQVTGRVGRGHNLSKFFVQTRLAEHPVLQAVLHRSWEQFYTYELSKRKQFTYPPYSFVAIAKISKKSERGAEQAAHRAYAHLASQTRNVKLLGPSPSYYEKSNGVYSWQLVMKAHKRSLLVKACLELPAGWTTDIDPINLL